IHSEENKGMEKLLGSLFNNVAVKDVTLFSGLDEYESLNSFANYKIYSFSPFDPKYTQSFIEDNEKHSEKLCTTLVNNCYTTENTIDQSIDINELGGPIFGDFLINPNNVKMVDINPDEPCIWESESLFKV